MSILEHDAVKDLMQFIGVILLMGVIWFFNGGKERVIGQRTNVIVTDSSGRVVPNANLNSGSYGSRAGDTSTTRNGAGAAAVPRNPYLADEAYKDIANKSDLFKIIRMSRPSGAASEDLTQEYITLTYRKIQAPAAADRINISGWMFRSTKTGHQVSIGTAVLLPSSYASTAVKGEDPIVLRPGDIAIVSSARSPIGNSFLINKCSGYLSQFQTFNPYLNISCPLLRDEKLPAAPNNLNDACLNYLNSWPSCGNQLRNLPERLSHECQVWIADHANYNSCVSLHQPDADFFSNEWRIFLNRSEPLWKTQRETIQLLDRSGKVVDEVSY